MPSPDDPPGAFDPTTSSAPGTAVDARHNGHEKRNGAGAFPPIGDATLGRPRRPPGPSTKPALIVLGIIFVLFLVGVGLELLSGNQSRPTAAPTKIATARGAVLHAVPARPLLKAITSAGQPPDDLLNALAVPRGATPVPSSVVDNGVELYDRSLRFNVSATQQDVISFFRAQLPALNWRRLSQGPTGTSGAYLILEQHPASDGHEWDVGVTVSPTSFGAQGSQTTQTTQTTQDTLSPQSGSAGATVPTGTTSFTLRLYSVSDQD
jgi:hypothetical protein